MLLFFLLILGFYNVLIPMEYVENTLYNSTQAHIDPSLLNKGPIGVQAGLGSPEEEKGEMPVEIVSESEYLSTTKKAPIKICKTYDFRHGGQIYLCRFYLGKKALKKSRPYFTDWFNTLVDELIVRSKRNKKIPAQVTAFSQKTGNVKTRKIKGTSEKIPQTYVRRGAKIATSIQRKISKSDAKQWLYFKTIRNKKSSR